MRTFDWFFLGCVLGPLFGYFMLAAYIRIADKVRVMLERRANRKRW